jgi:hypothetical protein
VALTHSHDMYIVEASLNTLDNVHTKPIMCAILQSLLYNSLRTFCMPQSNEAMAIITLRLRNVHPVRSPASSGCLLLSYLIPDKVAVHQLSDRDRSLCRYVKVLCNDSPTCTDQHPPTPLGRCAIQGTCCGLPTPSLWIHAALHSCSLKRTHNINSTQEAQETWQGDRVLLLDVAITG